MKRIISLTLSVLMLVSGIPLVVSAGTSGETIVDDLSGNLLLYSSFDNENANDESGKGHNGAVNGTVSYVDGISGKALYIKGEGQTGLVKATDYVSYGKNSDIIPSTGDFSFSVFFRATGTVGKASTLLSNKSYKSGQNTGFALLVDSSYDRQLNIGFEENGTKKLKEDIKNTAAPLANDGSWHMLTAIFDRDGSASYYIDETLVGKVNISACSTMPMNADIETDDGNYDKSGDLSLDLNLGADGNGWYGVSNSEIDELRIYDKALSEDEIGELYTYYANYESFDMSEGLILYSSFDGENANDESGKGHNGTVTGNVGYVNGISGKALYIESQGAYLSSAADNYVSYGASNAIIPNTDDFTFNMFFKATGPIEEGATLISNKNYVSGKNTGFALIADYEDNDYTQIINTGLDGTRLRAMNGNSGAIQANDGDWHMLTGTFDRDGSVSFYIDGRLIASNDISGYSSLSLNASLALNIGADGNGCYGTNNSVIDELRIYDRALSANDVTAIYKQTMGEKPKVEAGIGKLLDTVKAITPNSVYPQDKINEVTAFFEASLTQLSALDDDEALALLDECEKAYLKLLNSGAKPLASFHIVSDVHSYNGDEAYVAALKTMANINADTTIGLLVTGDITNSATEKQYNSFYNKTATYSPVPAEKVMVVLGNHDVRGSSDRYSVPSQYDPNTSNWGTAKDRYLSRNEPYMPNTDTVYFSKELGGYTFIMLNTELDLSDAMYMSVEQLEWLEQTLKTAYEKDPTKPIFIASHQPLYDTHYESNRWRTFIIGDMKTGEFMNEAESNDAIKEVLEKYPTTVFISGHIHNNFGTTVGVVRPFGAAVDLPALGKGSVMGGGYEAQIYENEIVFRAINFATGEYLPMYDIVIAVGENNVSAIYQQAQSVLADADKYAAEDIAEIQTLSSYLYGLLNVKYSDVSTDRFYTSAQHAEINTAAQSLKAALNSLQLNNGSGSTDDSDQSDGSDSSDSSDTAVDTSENTDTDAATDTDSSEKTNGDEKTDYIIPIIIAISVLVCVGVAIPVVLIVKRKSKN